MGRGSRAAGRGAIGIVVLLLVACVSSTREPAPTLEIATPAPSPTAALLSADVGATIETVVLACREKDAARLNALLATPVPAEQVQALFARGRDVVLKSQTPAVDGDEASVAVDLEVQRATGPERVQRTWDLARAADGLWRLTALPDCY